MALDYINALIECVHTFQAFTFLIKALQLILRNYYDRNNMQSELRFLKICTGGSTYNNKIEHIDQLINKALLLYSVINIDKQKHADMTSKQYDTMLKNQGDTKYII